MNDIEVAQKQFEALVAFQKSIGRSFTWLRWPHKKMAEPREHAAWRFHASHVERLMLLFNAGLADSFPDSPRALFEKLLYEASNAERQAWSAWMHRKERLEMQLLTGRRKHLPWGC
jgi:hypothetical protein